MGLTLARRPATDLASCISVDRSQNTIFDFVINRCNATFGLRNCVKVGGNLPELQLATHLYSARPADGFAFINTLKLPRRQIGRVLIDFENNWPCWMEIL